MIAKKSTLVVIQNLMGMIFGFITLKFVAMQLGTDAYGQMVIGFAVVSLFSFLAGLGFGSSHMKRISEGKDLGECIGTFIAIRLATTALMVLAVVASLWAWTTIYPSGLQDVSIGVILAVLVYFIFAGLASIPTLTFDARTETSKSQLSNMAQHPIKMVAVIFVVMAAGGSATTLSNSDMAYRLTWAYYTIGMMGTMLLAWGMFFYYKYPVKKPT
jgi:O-antigen/teichoic acid export membrane protein